MAIVGYVKPRFNQSSFTCPHCGCFSQIEWGAISNGQRGFEATQRWITSRCIRCGDRGFWHNEDLVWPIKSGIPDVIDGCPENVRTIYNEAREVFPSSPRASAALLRLAVQLVCKEKGLPAKDLNSDIGELVKLGLSGQIQQSLDILRVVGNHAVHPGQIEIEENKEEIEKFFGLLSLIVDVLVVQPAKIGEMFSTLVPQKQQEQIAQRDSKA